GTSKSVDLPPVPPAPGKQRNTVLPEFPGGNSGVIGPNSGISSVGGGVTNIALEDD
ncbi:hypothetical protein KR215_004811, partial [Drosophila sulfurigaster]